MSLLYPKGSENASGSVRGDLSFLEQLGFRSIFSIKRRAGQFNQLEDDLSIYFTTDTAVIKYRLDIIEDLLGQSLFVRAIGEILPRIDDIAELQENRKSGNDLTSDVYSITELDMYIECIDSLSSALSGVSGKFKSDGLREFADTIIYIAQSDEFKALKDEAVKISSSVRNIKSISIGVNLDAQLKPLEAGLVSVNKTAFRSGEVIDRVLRLDAKDDGFRCLAPLAPSRHDLNAQQFMSLNAALNSALERVFQTSVKSWRPILRKYILGHTDFIISVAHEMRFLLGAVELIGKLKQTGLPVCKPEIVPMNEKKCALKGLYNPVLAIKGGKPDDVVKNDAVFDADGMIYILTGPNRGGKSVFTYSVGLAQIMLQLGLFVPAMSAVMSPVDGIFTHFTSGEEDTINKGRLGQECARFNEILSSVSEFSLVLMDESFSSTSAIEGAFIAGEVLTGFSLIGCRCIFSTHLHDLAEKAGELSAPEGVKIDNLVAGMSDSEQRSFKIARRKPDGRSYARDIAVKYGITLDDIKKKVKGETQ